MDADVTDTTDEQPVRPRRRWLDVVVWSAAVLTPVAMIVAVTVISEMNTYGPAKISATYLKVGNLKQAVQTYYTTVGEYPSQEVGFAGLLAPPDGYKPMLESPPKDEWGNAFVYFSPPKKGRAPFEVVSMGPDGELGTDDDISSARRER